VSVSVRVSTVVYNAKRLLTS